MRGSPFYIAGAYEVDGGGTEVERLDVRADGEILNALFSGVLRVCCLRRRRRLDLTNFFSGV